MNSNILCIRIFLKGFTDHVLELLMGPIIRTHIFKKKLFKFRTLIHSIPFYKHVRSIRSYAFRDAFLKSLKTLQKMSNQIN